MNLSRNKFINILNAMGNEAGSSFTIDAKATPVKQEKQFGLLLADMDNNFIMENIPNVIRGQIYSYLKSNELVTRDLGFWMTGKQGDEVIHDNSIEGSSRDGNPATDFAKISGEPETEIQILELSSNYAVDVKTNLDLQKWASIDSGLSWINTRIGNATASIDKYLHNVMMTEINGYTGYKEVLIDSTGLTDEQIAMAIEKVMGEQLGELGYEYTNDKNEIAFDNVEKPEEVGAIFSNKLAVSRIVDYKRNIKNPDGGLDWGLGHITQKILTEDKQVILLPKSKYKAGAFFGSLNTALGFALIENLKTSYVFHGSVFMKSAPAVRITATPETPAVYFGRVTKKKDELIKLIDSKLADVKDSDLSAIDKKTAMDQLQNLRKTVSAVSVKKMVENCKVVKYNPHDLSTKVVIEGNFNNTEEDPERIAKLQEEKAELQKALEAKELADKEHADSIANMKKEIEEMKELLKETKKATPAQGDAK